jgi:hypothetical protein
MPSSRPWPIAYIGRIAAFGAVLFLFGQPLPVAAVDMDRCIRLRDLIQGSEKAQGNAQARLDDMKPRLDSISKKIDDLSVKEADDYLTTGRVNPDRERQLSQLRAEYKSLTQGLLDTIKAAKRSKAAYEGQMQAEGCPAPNTPEPTNTTRPRHAAPLSTPLDTSKTTGEQTMTFEDKPGQRMRLTAPSDFRTMTVDGTLTGGFLGLKIRLSFDCPVRTASGSGPVHYAYECNVSMKAYDPRDSMVVSATGTGRGIAGLYLAKDHKSTLYLNIQKLTITDPASNPPTTTRHYNTEFRLHEVAS